MVIDSLKYRRPVDPAGLILFRFGFGLLMVFSAVRYWYMGWIEELLLLPSFHFNYYFFEWVQPWTGNGLYIHFAAMIISALCVMIGFRTRLFAALFFVLFTYIELIEKACYLNHYYFVSIMAFLMALLPIPNGGIRHEQRLIPVYVYWVLRLQVGLVYFYAGLAKVGHDWLLRGEPLYTWLQSYSHWPLVGEVMTTRAFAITMGWGGAIFDLTIVGWLLWRKSRPWAYAVLCFFHIFIWLLFPIGIFSWVMILSATVFFAPTWPRRFIQICSVHSTPVRKISWSQLAILPAVLVLQLLLPLRHYLYEGPVNWTEEGFRFAWRVMLIEKAGHLEYIVQTDDRRFYVFPQQELPYFQYKMLATQPDFILQYAHHLAERYSQKGLNDIQVFARSHIWFNGRASQQYIDPHIDLAAQPRGFHGKTWILPMKP